MRFKITGAGSGRGTAEPANTDTLLKDVYNSDFHTAVLKTHQEFARRNVRVSDAEAAQAVMARIAQGEQGVLPNFERAQATVAAMEQRARGGAIDGGAQ